MNYEEAREYIKEKEKIGSVFGLESIKTLLGRLDNPEKNKASIHIAGTNGKGSILAYVEETLIEMGENVARYISPTIFDYRERWKHNKVWSSEEEVEEALTEVRNAVESMEKDGMDSPTAFEIETATFFLLSQRWESQVNLIECGMGGRLDATNVIEEDAINLLASVSFDHMQILGDTLAQIAEEKLGIVRDGSVLVTYPQCEEVKNVVREYCKKHNVMLVEADMECLETLEENIHGSTFDYKGRVYKIQMGGGYQISNAITAIEVLGVYIKKNHPDYDDERIYQIIYDGLKNTLWEGRFEVVRDKPLIIVDGAHNEDGWRSLRESIDNHFTNNKIIYIIGVFADKQYDRMIQMLGPTADIVYAIQSDSPRALAAEELSREFEKAGVKSKAVKRPEEALELAVRKAEEESGVIIVSGTLSILGDMIKCIKSRR